MLDLLSTNGGHNEEPVPTERLPTIAIFLCLGAAGILLMQCDESRRNHQFKPVVDENDFVR